jgi:predicted Rossmann fold nucleotide-binding protein DprA/Smf involved in DNA uptake
VSGGARGVDQVAMLSALNAGGCVIGVMADGLFKAAISGKYRESIQKKRLVLVSPFHPEARFMVGNAMGRNKLVYALADFALVVSAEKGKGGTWTGAKEELNRAMPKPVFVRLEEDAPEGNRALINIGARPFPEPPWKDNIRKLLEEVPLAAAKSVPTQVSLFGEPELEPMTTVSVKEEKGIYEDQTEVRAVTPIEKTTEEVSPTQTAYEAVLPVLLNALQDWKTPKDLLEDLEIRKVQLNDWIRRALEEDIIEKKSHPVHYRRK